MLESHSSFIRMICLYFRVPLGNISLIWRRPLVREGGWVGAELRISELYAFLCLFYSPAGTRNLSL